MRRVGEQASPPDPWPLYAQLRHHRVMPLEEHNFAIGRYDDVLALLHDPRVSSDLRNLTDPGDAMTGGPLPFIRQDPSEAACTTVSVRRWLAGRCTWRSPRWPAGSATPG
jgi:hypothetical protein